MWNNNLYFDIIQLSQCCNNKSFFTCQWDCSGLILPDKAWPLTPHFHLHLAPLFKCETTFEKMYWIRSEVVIFFFSLTRSLKSSYCNTTGPHNAEAVCVHCELWLVFDTILESRIKTTSLLISGNKHVFQWVANLILKPLVQCSFVQECKKLENYKLSDPSVTQQYWPKVWQHELMSPIISCWSYQTTRQPYQTPALQWVRVQSLSFLMTLILHL